MADPVSINSGALQATFVLRGAELQSLKTTEGHELMSSGDPAYWSGRAPLLFPIVGRLQDDLLRVGVHNYPMVKHGFARKSDFLLIDHTPDSALFRLGDTAQSRAQYPFAFELDAFFQLDGATLAKTITVRNTGRSALPFSFGFHPAFAWPLPFGGDRADHEIIFDQDEPALLRRVTPYGTIAQAPVATPVSGRTITLADNLFNDDALVWDRLNSRQLSYGIAGGARLDIAFPDTDWLGIWTKPGAAFICVEPWAGMADPEGYCGDFFDKPGVIQLAAGAERAFGMTITLSGQRPIVRE